MPTGILFVESTPRSPDHLAAFHEWYDEVHLPEILDVEGFASAARFAETDGESFLAIYEIDGDLDTAKAALVAARAAGRMTDPVGVQLKPPPVARYFARIG